MGPPSFIPSVVDRNVGMRRMAVYGAAAAAAAVDDEDNNDDHNDDDIKSKFC